MAYAKASGLLNRYAAPGVSTFPTLGSVPTGGTSKRASHNLITDFCQWLVQPNEAIENTLGATFNVVSDHLGNAGISLFVLRTQRFFYQHLDEAALGTGIGWRTLQRSRLERLALKVSAGKADDLARTTQLLEHASEIQVAAAWETRTATKLARLSTLIDVGSFVAAPILAGALQYYMVDANDPDLVASPQQRRNRTYAAAGTEFGAGIVSMGIIAVLEPPLLVGVGIAVGVSFVADKLKDTLLYDQFPGIFGHHQ